VSDVSAASESTARATAVPRALPAAGYWLLAGTFITTIGNALQTLTVGKLLYDHTGSIGAFGSVLIFEQIITFVMQLVAGPWVDRGDPRRTCVQVEMLRGVVICAASLMLMVSGHPVGWILVMTLVIRVAQPFYRAATFALAPAVVPAEALTRFNGVSNVCLQAGQLLGVAIAGPILLYAGAPTAFFVNGLSFVLSGLTTLVIAVPAGAIVKAEAKATAWQQLLGGWREIGALLRREAGLGWHLLLSSADNIGVLLFNLSLVPLVAVRFGGSPTWLSIVDGAYAVGAIASVAAVEPMSERWGARATVIAGIGGQAACFALLCAAPAAWLSVPLAFGIGAFNTISWTVVMTTLQLRARGPVKGRIATVRNLVTAVISVALVPVVTRLHGVSLELALLASGAVCFAFALVAIVLGRRSALGSQLLGERA
jgi:MFS family permease